MPSTPWQTEILAPVVCRGGAAHLAHALLQCELAGEARRRHDIAGAPDAGAAALAMRNQHRPAEPRSDRRGGVADMDQPRKCMQQGC